MIIFDWDDTLCNSSWIDRECLLRTPSYNQLPRDVQIQLAAVERCVIKCLEKAAQLGTVVIITNSESGWVELSAQRFMPRVLPALANVKIVSARTTYESAYPGAPICWKAAAFAHEVREIFHDNRQSLKNIVSLGDSVEERTAVKIVAGQISSRSKSIKFVDCPNPQQLCRQVEMVTHCFEQICKNATDLDLMLTTEPLEGQMEDQTPENSASSGGG